MVHTIAGTSISGVLYAIVAAVSFALWNVFLQRGLVHGGSTRLVLFILALCEVACFLPVVLLLAWRGALPPLPGRGLVWFVMAGLLTSIAGTFLATQATRRIGAAQTTALRLLDPFFAYVIATLFLSEKLSARAVGGILILAVALVLLQRDRKETTAAARGPGRAGGMAFAVAASLAFTVASIVRKVGLAIIPSAIVAAMIEGTAGLVVVGAIVLFSGSGRQDVREMRRPAHRDLWWAGCAAASGTFFLNLALQRVPVPIAVALRNTSPWFALAFIPLLISVQHRPGRLVWASTGLLTVGMLLIVLR